MLIELSGVQFGLKSLNPLNPSNFLNMTKTVKRYSKLRYFNDRLRSKLLIQRVLISRSNLQCLCLDLVNDPSEELNPFHLELSSPKSLPALFHQ